MFLLIILIFFYYYYMIGLGWIGSWVDNLQLVVQLKYNWIHIGSDLVMGQPKPVNISNYFLS